MSREAPFLGPALERVGRVREALDALPVDFDLADRAIRDWEQGWIRGCLAAVERAAFPGREGEDPPIAEILHNLEQDLRRLEAATATVSVTELGPEAFQLHHLLVVLLTGRFHLGDFMLFALDEGARPEPRVEFESTTWQFTVKTHHALARRTLAFLIAHRKESERCSRRLPDHRLPVRLGWVKQGGETLLADLLEGRSPLYLHQLFEVLLLIEEPMSRFVEYLYFMEVRAVGTSGEQLRAVDPLALKEAE